MLLKHTKGSILLPTDTATLQEGQSEAMKSGHTNLIFNCTEMEKVLNVPQILKWLYKCYTLCWTNQQSESCALGQN